MNSLEMVRYDSYEFLHLLQDKTCHN